MTCTENEFHPASVETLRGLILKETVEVNEVIGKLLKEAGYFVAGSLSADGWKNGDNKYFAILLHYIDPNLDFRSVVLGMGDIENEKAETLGERIRDTLCEWELAVVIPPPPPETIEEASSSWVFPRDPEPKWKPDERLKWVQ